MRIIPHLLLLLPTLYVGINASAVTIQSVCSPSTPITIRREIRSLSSSELSDFLQAFQKLHAGPSPTLYDQYVAVHLDNAPANHNTPHFLPWHRLFTRVFEIALQKASGDSTMAIPYWDWSRDAKDPASSPVFNPSTFGTNGRPSDECVYDGSFTNWQCYYPETHCLQRRFNNGTRISPFYPISVMNQLVLSQKTFEEFWQSLEPVPHNQVHQNIGGDMPNYWSVNDPLFFLHHSFVDKIYADWQKQDPGPRQRDFVGSLSETLPPYAFTVADVMDHRGQLCYDYDDDNAGLLRRRQLQKRQADQEEWDLMPNELDAAWIEKMGFDVVKIREWEAKAREIIRNDHGLGGTFVQIG